ncbi:hypothetical protein B0H10DRAFT_2214857 [Mycena sp. CBHHK59/15]|nr:hypothetical protein B0H10DRAFT_2214857 [Mycena sp. CBHHK59/15]
MADSARPRPRPRPRPVPRAKQAEASSSVKDASALPVVVDDDTMFIRNQGRSTTTWKKLEAINKESKSKPARSDSDGERDLPRPRKQKKQSGEGWQSKKLARLLSEGLSEDSDSDPLEITDASGSPSKNKRKRRSRSRSITPPPELRREQIQLTHEIIRKALHGEASAPARAPSPTLYEADESTDTIVLDPELARIANSVALKAHRPYSEPSDNELSDTVTITVKWQPHPLSEKGKIPDSAFKMNRNDNFRHLFEAVAEDACILADNLIMSYNGRRFFPSINPSTLKLWGEAELLACDKTTWEYLRTNPVTTAVVDRSADLSDTDAPSPAHSNAQESDAESEAGGETFKLILRSAVTTKNITVTVRPTTTCGAIVKAFLKKAGLADKYGQQASRKSIDGSSKKGKGKKGAASEPEKDPQLEIDGDKMAHHVEIGDMDLDDGDMVEVVGL